MMLIILLVILGIYLVWCYCVRGSSSKNDASSNPIEFGGTVQWISTPHPSGKYGDYNPAERYPDVVKAFGKPDLIDRGPGGVAIWNRKTLKAHDSCFDRMEIRDEQIPHGDHADFLYTWMYLDVPQHLQHIVRDLSESVTYDPLKKMITSRCHYSAANQGTLWLALQLVLGNMDLATAKANYKATIQRIANDPQFQKQVLKDLCQYVYKLMGPDY